jgi:hypothetical protein
MSATYTIRIHRPLPNQFTKDKIERSSTQNSYQVKECCCFISHLILQCIILKPRQKPCLNNTKQHITPVALPRHRTWWQRPLGCPACAPGVACIARTMTSPPVATMPTETRTAGGTVRRLRWPQRQPPRSRRGRGPRRPRTRWCAGRPGPWANGGGSSGSAEAGDLSAESADSGRRHADSPSVAQEMVWGINEERGVERRAISLWQVWLLDAGTRLGEEGARGR